MDLVPGIAVVVVGSILAVVMTIQLARWNPFMHLPLIVGNPEDYPFGLYVGRSTGFLFLGLGGSVLYMYVGIWALVLTVLGAGPAWLLTRDHNRRLDGDFGPEAI